MNNAIETYRFSAEFLGFSVSFCPRGGDARMSNVHGGGVFGHQPASCTLKMDLSDSTF